VIVRASGLAELEIKAAGIFTYGTDRDNPDFAITHATGLSAARVEKAAALDNAAAVVRRHRCRRSRRTAACRRTRWSPVDLRADGGIRHAAGAEKPSQRLGVGGPR
jgi:hypothetical protein